MLVDLVKLMLAAQASFTQRMEIHKVACRQYQPVAMYPTSDTRKSIYYSVLLLSRIVRNERTQAVKIVN